jgi:hypothetical protein
MIYAVELAPCGMIYLPSFMKIATAHQAILRFCLRNLVLLMEGIYEVHC